MTWATFYLICFVVGFALSFFALLGGAGHHGGSGKLHLPHWGHAGVHHGGVGHGTIGHVVHAGQVAHGGQGAAHASGHGGQAKGGAHVSPFDFSTITAFLAWFGGTGYLLTRYSGLWTLLALGIAVFGGLVGAAIVFWFLVKVLLAHETILDPSDFDMVGVLARVNSSIRPGGTGEIVFSQAGVRRPSGARSEDGLAIPKGQEVVVTRYEKGIAYVRRWEDMTKDELVEAHEGKQEGATERSTSKES